MNYETRECIPLTLLNMYGNGSNSSFTQQVNDVILNLFARSSFCGNEFRVIRVFRS